MAKLALATAVTVAAGLLGVSHAQAQTTVTRSETAQSGKATRLLIAPNLKTDCSNGPIPEIKVTTAPKSGSLITKSGKVKTSARYRCPNKDATAQAVFYQSQPNFTGSDAVMLEVKTSDGATQTVDIRISVEAAKKDDAGDKKGATDL